jgi:hypothetical protein
MAMDVKVKPVQQATRVEIVRMNDEQNKEEWLKLCEQAAVEQDPEKLLFLTREINRLLEERENLLREQRRS